MRVEIADNNRKQKENAFILYMMIGSMYGKCICRTPYLADTLLLYYREMPEGKQIRQETNVLRFLEREHGAFFADLGDLHCEARLMMDKAGDCRILFGSGIEDVEVRVEPDGRYEVNCYDICQSA